MAPNIRVDTLVSVQSGGPRAQSRQRIKDLMGIRGVFNEKVHIDSFCRERAPGTHLHGTERPRLSNAQLSLQGL